MKEILIGYTDGNRPVKLNGQDLETHVHGIGASRTGKSKLVESVVREMISERQGCCVIDPHGFLYQDILRWLAYIEPKRNIVLFNPSSSGRIVGFNPFRATGGDISTQADRRVKATVKAWGAANTDETPRLERWLRSLYYALIEQGYPLDVARHLLSFREKNFREYLVGRIQSDVIRAEFEELSDLSRLRDFTDQIESTRNRLFRFLAPQQLRRIMCLNVNNLNLQQIVDRGDILLVNLQPSENLTEENARVIGTLLLNELWEIGMRRKQTPAGKPPSSFYIIIDEFQKFLTPDIPDMLDQAAKYGLHLMLFHQHLSQLRELDESAYGAIMTNARTKIVFGGLSRDDARTIAQEIFPGQIDLKRIKFLIEQTKFRPVYGRDKVYTHSSGGSLGSTTQEGTAWQYTDDGAAGWTDSSGSASSDSSSWQDGESDIPIFTPEEFKELSSLTAYSLEEQLWELSDKIMQQNQRAFLIRRPGQETIAAVTPYVKTWYIAPERLNVYIEERLKGFLTTTEVDRALQAAHVHLLQEAKLSPVEIPYNPDEVWEKPLDK